MVLDPVVAQAVGARDPAAVARGIQRGVLLALILAVPSIGVTRRLNRIRRRPPRPGPRAAAPISSVATPTAS